MFSSCVFILQVRTSWRWHAYLREQLVQNGLVPVRLNLDETSIVLNHDEEKGVVSKNSKGKLIFVKKKSKKRGSLTHVAVVCDDTSLQPLLPQLIIGNDNVLRVTDLTMLETCLPDNVVVVRAKSSWITVELFIVLLEMLRRIFNKHQIQRVPILLLDCCPVHLHARVWKAAKRNSIYLCFVPASLTWLLQPLDVKILRRMKAFLRTLYRRSQIENKAALVPMVQVIKNIAQAVRKILQGSDWTSAFDACGYSMNMSNLTSNIQRVLHVSGNIAFDHVNRRPEDAEILQILPRKRKYELRTLFWDPVFAESKHGASDMPSVARSCPPAERTGLPSSSSTGFPSRSMGVEASMDDNTPIALRTRSHSRLLLEAGGCDHDARGSSTLPGTCPLSMLLPVPGVPLRAHTPRRPRAQALSRPRRPRTL